VAYRRGVAEIGDRVWAYLQPNGGWGWSNAGLVSDGRHSLIVDTLFDLRLTAEMLSDMDGLAPRAGIVVNTHANGDHCFGNSLLPSARIVASAACAAEMAELPPSRLADLMKAAPTLGQLGEFVQRIFGPFEFEGVEMVLPTETFSGSLDLAVGDRLVRLLEVGPAHTAGDVVVHLPAERVVFTGDILFHGGHPIVWAGPVANWIAACDQVLDLEPSVVVPGHGPIATPAALADLKAYFEWLTVEARARFDAGLSFLDAARDIDLEPYADWSEAERLPVNVAALYRDFGAEVPNDVATLFGAMAAFAG
jgi:glyoxylase-like metal-dependent hydrolase (beta-lactamase superfamily II)